MDIVIKEVEVSRLNLLPGEVLAVTFKDDDIDMSVLGMLREKLNKVFPNNKVLLFAVGTNNEVKFTVMSEPQALGCGTQNYCSDCNCGKKGTIVDSVAKEFENDQ